MMFVNIGSITASPYQNPTGRNNLKRYKTTGWKTYIYMSN